MVKLSLIIPYFETAELTKRLLLNLMIQCHNFEVEIIVIDDNYKPDYRLDKYVEYLRNEFNLEHKGLKIIHHEHNMGTAKTRNEGIKMAQGQYIGFIDCDDMVTDDYIERLLKAIEEKPTEVINFNWLGLSENEVVCRPTNPAMWKAIYRKDKCPLFREDLQWGEEDVDFQQEVQNMETTYLDRVLYLYESNREGSLFWRKTHGGKQ